MIEKVRFKVSAGLKNIIGRELITDDIVAVFELVKNSFDAGATQIELLISPNHNRIEIKDNGCGMSPNDLKNKWLFIAYSEKKQSNGAKIYAGSKGIGRFSCDTLGSKLFLCTRKDGVTSTISIDWDLFENNDENQINELDVIISQSSEDSYKLGNSGTLIIIEDLRTNWDLKHAQKALSRLKQLLNPIDSENTARLTFAYDSENSSENISEIVRNDAFLSLSEKTAYIQCDIDDGFLTLNLNAKGHVIYSSSYRNPFSIKNISSRIYFMDTASKRDFKNKTGMDSVSFGNIFIFKNNFRVYPYGEIDYDIFNINLRKSQGYNRYLGGRELLGWINIVDTDNSFVESSSRNNGFISGRSLTELESFYYDFIQKSLEKYVAVTRFGSLDIDSVTDTEAKKNIVINELTSHLNKYSSFLVYFEPFDIPVQEASIKQRISALNSENLPKKQKKVIAGELENSLINLQKENDNLKKNLDDSEEKNERLSEEIKRKQVVLNKTKPDRQVFLAHELTKASNDIDALIDELKESSGNIELLAELKKVSLKLSSIKNLVLRTDLNTMSAVEIDLVSFIKECFNMSIYKKKKMSVVFENDDLILTKKVKLFEFHVILDNLYINAKELGATFFKIIFNKESIIFVSDTGPISDEIINNAFNLGFSTKNGTGFGLYLVKDIVNDHGWNIKMIGDNKTKNVYFELEF